ncbi:hypothetical protein FRC08_005229 [Ceratobasidium sp. 394]|nr:hypothetical protein FRC08_005229 [Ceratobasidium sp. 394]
MAVEFETWVDDARRPSTKPYPAYLEFADLPIDEACTSSANGWFMRPSEIPPTAPSYVYTISDKSRVASPSDTPSAEGVCSSSSVSAPQATHLCLSPRSAPGPVVLLIDAKRQGSVALRKQTRARFFFSPLSTTPPRARRLFDAQSTRHLVMNTLDDADICDTHGHIALQSGAARPVIAMSSPAGNALPPPVGSLSTPPACFCPLEDDDEDILRATPPPCPRHPYPGPAASPCSPGGNPGHACDLSTFNDCGGYRSPSPDAPEQRLVPRSSPPKATRSASIERHAPRGESPPPRGGQ